MTVSTTVNSLLLTYGPIFVAYQGLGLKQFNAYHGCLFAAIAFLITQIAKFILLALLFPIIFPGDNVEIDSATQTAFIVEHDILRALVSVIDVYGLYYIINDKKLINIMGDIEVKILSVGLGWAFSELLTTQLLDIIFQAWSNEFKTQFIIQALTANLDALEILALSTIAYSFTKKDESKRTIGYILVLSRYLFPVALRFVKENELLDEATFGCCDTCGLIAKAVFAFVFFQAASYLK